MISGNSSTLCLAATMQDGGPGPLCCSTASLLGPRGARPPT